jgi:hypothetical protein
LSLDLGSKITITALGLWWETEILVHLPKIEIEIAYWARLILHLAAVVITELVVLIEVTMNDGFSIERL